MTDIATNLNTIDGSLSDIKTAIVNKGGTVSGNITTFATAIDNISSGYTEFPPYKIVNGVVSRRSLALNGTEFSDITSIDTNGLYQTFIYCDFIGSLRFANLTTIGQNGLYQTFAYSNLTSLSFSKLKTINDSGLSYAFYTNTNLRYVNFYELDTIKNQGLNGCFVGCTNLEYINFWNLKSSSFNIGSDQFKNMLLNTGTTKVHELHFPSGLQSTIQNLSGYPNFGGTSGYVTIVYDL